MVVPPFLGFDCLQGYHLTHRFYRRNVTLPAVEDEDELERLLMAYSPQLRQILKAAEREIEEGLGQRHEEFWAEIENEETRSIAG